MPVLWGHERKEYVMDSGGIEHYAKWFDLMEMRFSLHRTVDGWVCEATFYEGSGEKYTTPSLPTISEALHSIYALVMRDVRNPF